MAKIPAKMAPAIINTDPNLRLMDSAPEDGGGAFVELPVALEVAAAVTDFKAEVEAAEAEAEADLEAEAEAVADPDAVVAAEAVVDTVETIVN